MAILVLGPIELEALSTYLTQIGSSDDDELMAALSGDRRLLKALYRAWTKVAKADAAQKAGSTHE